MIFNLVIGTLLAIAIFCSIFRIPLDIEDIKKIIDKERNS